MNRRAQGLRVAALPSALAAALALATARAAVIEPDLEQALENGGEVAFIAQFGQDLDLSVFPGQGQGGGTQLAALLWALQDQADASQKTAVALLQAGGATRITQLWSINALAATAAADVIRDLAALPEIERIELDGTLAAPNPEPAATSTEEWNLVLVGAPDVWAQLQPGTGEPLTGAGAVVAGMDTGVDAAHSDLSGRWRGGSNSWFDPNGEHATPYDPNGHGTGAMSVAVGGDAGGTAIGVAPGAQWIAVKIFNDAGYASLSAIHAGFQWLLDPDGYPATNDGPDVVNNSWGYPDKVNQCYGEFEADVHLLKIAGIATLKVSASGR
jgi:serine protease AprX